MRKDVQGDIEFFSCLPHKAGSLFKTFSGKIISPGAEAELRQPHVHGVSTVVQCGLQFFHIARWRKELRFFHGKEIIALIVPLVRVAAGAGDSGDRGSGERVVHERGSVFLLQNREDQGKDSQDNEEGYPEFRAGIPAGQLIFYVPHLFGIQSNGLQLVGRHDPDDPVMNELIQFHQVFPVIRLKGPEIIGQYITVRPPCVMQPFQFQQDIPPVQFSFPVLLVVHGAFLFLPDMRIVCRTGTTFTT